VPGAGTTGVAIRSADGLAVSRLYSRPHPPGSSLPGVSNPPASCLAACSLPLKSAAFLASSSALVIPAENGLPVDGSILDPGAGTFGEDCSPPAPLE
jgi:hypothetical protein